MATPPIITRDVVNKMLSLLDYCYKLGVESAHDLQDEGLAREFLERSKEAGAYGILSDSPIYTTWQEWMLRLMAKARSTSWNGAMSQFLGKLGRFGANYLSAFLPMSFVYYRRGIEDYINAPGAADYSVFCGKTRVRWTKKGLKNVSPQEFVDDLQLLTFDLARRDSAVWEAESATVYQAKQIALTSRQYEHFRMAVGLAAQKKY